MYRPDPIFLLFRHGATESFSTAAATVVDVAKATDLIPDISKLIAEYAVTQLYLTLKHAFNRCDAVDVKILAAAPAAFAEIASGTGGAAVAETDPIAAEDSDSDELPPLISSESESEQEEAMELVD